MAPNFLVIVATAFIPFFVAYAWFHPKLFGGENWVRIAGLTEEQRNKKVTPFKLFLSVLLNLLLAWGLFNLCQHFSGVVGLVSADMEALNTGTAKAFLEEYGYNHLSIGHGMIHSIFPGVLSFVLPILGYVVIFEFKSRTYLLVYLGYWIVSMMLMGGIIGKWGIILPA